MTKKEAARILGLTENEITEEDIKKAFRQRSKKHHPDVGGTAEAFSKLQLAMDVLLDKQEPLDPNKDLSEFMSAFQAVVSNCIDYCAVDLVDRTKGIIRSRIQEIETLLTKYAAEEEKLKAIIQRLICTKSENILGNMLETQLAAVQAGINSNNELIACLHRAIKIGEDYKYIIDAPKSNLSSAYTNISIWRTY